MRGLEIWKPLIAACNGLTIGGGLEMPLEDGLKLEDDIQTEILSTADMDEGFAAFREKRQPEWKGR